MPVSDDELAERFAHHPPSTPEVIDAHQRVRELFTKVSIELNHLLPECREKSLALTACQEASMMANTAIALTQLGTSEPLEAPQIVAVYPSKGERQTVGGLKGKRIGWLGYAGDEVDVTTLDSTVLRSEVCEIPRVPQSAWSKIAATPEAVAATTAGQLHMRVVRLVVWPDKSMGLLLAEE